MISGTSKNILDLSEQELEQVLVEWNEPKYRARQLLRWLWKEGATDFSQMSNISKNFRGKLSEAFVITWPKIIKAQESDDGTIKYLFALADGKTVETVWIPRDDQERVTVCVSTQVGCKMGCTFCLTAQQKVERNLSAGEIAAQILALPNRNQVTNVVLMGMGEPLDNYDNVIGGLNLMSDPDMLSIGPKKITVSTSGLVPAIKKFVKATKSRLAISLNAPNDEIRSQIMPINKAYPIDMLLGAIKEIAKTPGATIQRDFYVTFEYILISGLNDQVEHAEELAKRLRGIPSKVNLLLYNENPNVPYKRPKQEDVDAFRRILGKHGLLNFVRASRGRDISAACGQLASEHKRSQQIQASI